MTDAIISPRRILYEDPDLLGVDKPSGIPSHATVDPNRDHLVAAVRRCLVDLGHMDPYLALHNRLDRGTSGAVVFARSPQVNAAITAALRGRRVVKIYWAILRDHPTKRFPEHELVRETFLAADRTRKGRRVSVRSGGDFARTRLCALARTGQLVLVEVRPETGRTHQIRVHLAELGFPIVGDELYGAADPASKRLLLHSRALGLAHPRTGLALHIEAPPPRAFVRRFAEFFVR